MGQKAEGSACVVCRASGRSVRHPPSRMSRVTVEARSLSLCREHAGQVAIHMPKTWEDLRTLFAFGSEKRSPVPRRHEYEDRRVFPPRPEGRRLSFGRRNNDPRE